MVHEVLEIHQNRISESIKWLSRAWISSWSNSWLSYMRTLSLRSYELNSLHPPRLFFYVRGHSPARLSTLDDRAEAANCTGSITNEMHDLDVES